MTFIEQVNADLMTRVPVSGDPIYVDVREVRCSDGKVRAAYFYASSEKVFNAVIDIPIEDDETRETAIRIAACQLLTRIGMANPYKEECTAPDKGLCGNCETTACGGDSVPEGCGGDCE